MTDEDMEKQWSNFKENCGKFSVGIETGGLTHAIGDRKNRPCRDESVKKMRIFNFCCLTNKITTMTSLFPNIAIGRWEQTVFSGRKTPLEELEDRVLILETTNTELQEKCCKLQEQVRQLSEFKDLFLEWYYAPGSPGYLKAQESFESQKKT